MKKLSLGIFTTVGLVLGASALSAEQTLPLQDTQSGLTSTSSANDDVSPRTFLLHKFGSHHLALWKHYCSFHPAHLFCGQVVSQPAPQPPVQQPQPPAEEPQQPGGQPDDGVKYPIPLPPNPGPDEPWPTVITVDGVDYPICSSSKSDADKDGWGWQDSQSCIVYHMPCSSPSLDTDGDGWGWENGESCSVWK